MPGCLGFCGQFSNSPPPPMVNHHALLYGDFTMFILLQQHLCLWRENTRTLHSTSDCHHRGGAGDGWEVSFHCYKIQPVPVPNLLLSYLCYIVLHWTVISSRTSASLEKKMCPRKLSFTDASFLVATIHKDSRPFTPCMAKAAHFSE